MNIRDFDFKKLFWLFPFISGILCVIAIVIPSGFQDVVYIFTKERTLNFWMWGLWTSSIPYGGMGAYFNVGNSTFVDLFSLIFGITCAGIILIVGIFVMIMANKMRKNTTLVERHKVLWIISGILILGATIAWMVQISFVNYYNIMVILFRWESSPPPPEWFTSSFWTYFKPDFGVIGPLAAGSLLLFSRLFVRVKR